MHSIIFAMLVWHLSDSHPMENTAWVVVRAQESTGERIEDGPGTIIVFGKQTVAQFSEDQNVVQVGPIEYRKDGTMKLELPFVFVGDVHSKSEDGTSITFSQAAVRSGPGGDKLTDRVECRLTIVSPDYAKRVALRMQKTSTSDAAQLSAVLEVIDSLGQTTIQGKHK